MDVHKFTPSIMKPSVCAGCYKPENHVYHTGERECESCSKVAKLKEMNTVWLCPECFDKEIEAGPVKKIVEKNPTTEIAVEERKIIADHKPVQLEQEAIDKLGSSAIKKAEDYFNANTKSMNERWLEIVADASIPEVGHLNVLSKHEQFGLEVKNHFLHIKKVSIQAVDIQLQCAAEMRSDQVLLNQNASKMREEIRTKLQLSNIDYVPTVAKPAKPVKVSRSMSVAEMYAKTMKIPVEVAQRILDNKLKEVTGVPCTCKETPGICKIHN